MIKLYHATSFPFNPKEGEEIILYPGTQNAQGIGVYFSEGEPDVRASDSVHLNGLAFIFVVDFDKSERKSDLWYRSKRSNDKRKGRPRTWHSKGRPVKITVNSVDGIFIYGRGEV